MKIRIALKLLLSLLVISINLCAQQIVPTSPEAAALTKMVNYPISFNTGIPNISIPLYEIQTGGMTLPITLNYHAGGFKINEQATSVGLGWSLSSDIQITRTINGLDDILLNGYINNNRIKAYHADNPERDLYPLLQRDASGPFTGFFAYEIAAGLKDGMPDKFNYKLLNKSGSFYFRKSSSGTSYTIVPVPYDNIKIGFDNGQFTIIDTDGTTYKFGGKGAINIDKIEEKAMELSGPPASLSRSSWKCTRIENATNTDAIEFTYRPKSQVSFATRNQSIEYFTNDDPCSMYRYFTQDDIKKQTPGIVDFEGLLRRYPFYSLSSPKYIENAAYGKSVFHLPIASSETQVYDNPYPFNGTSYMESRVYGLALSRIDFRGGSVIFNGTDALNSIRIQDKANEEIKTFTFFHSYAAPNNLEFAKNVNGFNFIGTRYLDSVQFKNGSSAYETYKLIYESKFCFGNHIQGKDAWGYPNAYTRERYLDDTYTTVPEQNIKQNFFKNIDNGCRNVIKDVVFKIGNMVSMEMPDPIAAKSGILKSIVYPTGAFTNFNYESNMYTQSVTEFMDRVGMSGGLRIKSIESFPGKSAKLSSQKYYRYGEVEDGIGLLINSPTRNYNVKKKNFDAYSYTQTTGYLTGPGSANFGNNFDPIPIGCSSRSCLSFRFKERKTTYLPASSSDYTYSNGAPIYYTKVTEYNQDYGTVTGKKVYTFYKPDHFQPYSFSGLSKIPGTNIDVLQTDGLMGKEKSIEDYKYEHGKFSLVHNKYFYYRKYSQDDQIRVVYSSFNTKYEVIGGNYSGSDMELYNTDKPFATGSMYDNPYTLYTASQYGIQVAKLLLTHETENWIKDADTTIQTTEYHYNDTYLQPTTIITYNSKGKRSAREFKYAYDFSNSLVYYQMELSNMISQVVEEVNYIGEIETARTKTNYQLVNNGNFIAPVSIQKSVNRNPLETVLTYDFYDNYANILQVTEKDKLIKSYLWAYGYKYPVAQILGSTYASATKGINVPALQDLTNDAQIKSIVNGIRNALPRSMVSTYFYKPLVGLTTEVNPNGQAKFYEYDPYGRLSVIKDHNLHIVKKYDYHFRSDALPNTGYSLNTPVMLTYNWGPVDSVRKVVNIIQPGGANVSNDDAEREIEYNWMTRLGNPDSSVPNATVHIKMRLNMWILPGLNTPGKTFIDFIKDNSIVATRKFPVRNTSANTDFYIEPGNYRIGIRFDENYNGSLNRVGLQFLDKAIKVRSGDSVNLLPGVTYDFILSNDY